MSRVLLPIGALFCLFAGPILSQGNCNAGEGYKGIIKHVDIHEKVVTILVEDDSLVPRGSVYFQLAEDCKLEYADKKPAQPSDLKAGQRVTVHSSGGFLRTYPALGEANRIVLEAEPMPQPKGKFELRMIRVGKTFQAIRFNVTTGETWRMVGDKYEKVPETDAIPAGDYDVTLVTDDTEWMAFRIDRVSGTTWQMRGEKWHKVKEPDPKKDKPMELPREDR
jgi:hypothetical protein